MEFTSIMCSCVPVIAQLLGPKNSSDVIESLQFLTSAYQFSLKAAPEAVRKALALVWSSDQHISEALVMMYKKLFLRFLHLRQYNVVMIVITVVMVRKDCCP